MLYKNEVKVAPCWLYNIVKSRVPCKKTTKGRSESEALFVQVTLKNFQYWTYRAIFYFAHPPLHLWEAEIDTICGNVTIFGKHVVSLTGIARDS